MTLGRLEFDNGHSMYPPMEKKINENGMKKLKQNEEAYRRRFES